MQVIDNGIGFPVAEAEKIFEPFVRLTREPAYASAGLGLAIAKKWLERHGAGSGPSRAKAARRDSHFRSVTDGHGRPRSHATLEY